MIDTNHIVASLISKLPLRRDMSFVNNKGADETANWFSLMSACTVSSR